MRRHEHDGDVPEAGHGCVHEAGHDYGVHGCDARLLEDSEQPARTWPNKGSQIPVILQNNVVTKS